MKIKIAVSAIMLLLVLNACESKSKSIADLDRRNFKTEETATSGNKATSQYFNSDSTGKQINDDQDPQKVKAGKDQQIAKPDWDKKIIKTASLNLEVKDYGIYSNSFRDKIRNLGGYIAQEEQNQSDYKIENTIVIKVPVDQFDNAVALLTSDVKKLNEKKISSQDVTAEYVDTKSRMEAKKQVRERYLDLLKQAKNMEEILNVQSEINGIQEEIESAAGQIEYLGHSAAFSTINLTYFQVLNSSAKSDDKPSFGTKVADAFKTGWGWIVDLFVGLVSIWPLLVVVFGLVIIYRRSGIGKSKRIAG